MGGSQPRRTAVPCCPPLLGRDLGPDAARTLAATFRALGDPARLRLLSLIASQAAGEACACHFTDELGLAQPTVSHHLRVLHEAGLVERERRGSWIYYRMSAGPLLRLRGMLPSESHARRARGA